MFCLTGLFRFESPLAFHPRVTNQTAMKEAYREFKTYANFIHSKFYNCFIGRSHRFAAVDEREYLRGATDLVHRSLDVDNNSMTWRLPETEDGWCKFPRAFPRSLKLQDKKDVVRSILAHRYRECSFAVDCILLTSCFRMCDWFQRSPCSLHRPDKGVLGIYQVEVPSPRAHTSGPIEAEA